VRLARCCLFLLAACLLVPASAAAVSEPTLGLTATNAQLGQPVHATATLAGGTAATGTISFSAFAADDPTCTGVPVFTDSATVDGDGEYSSANFSPTSAGTYRWSASYDGDAENQPAQASCAAASAIAKATPGLGTVATSATVGASISDSATISGGVNPTGSISFKAFGPDDATCALAAAFEATVAVSGNGSYGSGNFTPTAAGSYNWTASYSGDDDNDPASSGCGAANETSTVSKATPGLATTAANGTAGSPISDSATVSGGFAPTGSIVFKTFGPNDATCALAPAFEATILVSGNGIYGSGNFTPALVGSYRWTAAYSGDANNNAATSDCNAANETSTVAKDTPAIATTAAGATVGSAISDSATLSAGTGPTGSIVFKAFGAGDATCALAPVFEATIPVSGNDSYGSGNFIPTLAGSYRWTAAYSGDANNNAATSGCNAANETSTVAKAAPGIATTATSAPFGFPIADSATISGGFNPTGSIVFKAFGPADATCSSAAAFVATVPVNGAGSYGSGGFNGAQLGSYRWTAAYSGDANNNAATSGCNAANETSTVGDAKPALATDATDATIGSPISNLATISGGFAPTGQLSFKAFGPGNPTCTGAALFTANVPVAGNGTYSSGTFTPTQVGNYVWTVSYAGDANNEPASSGCGAAGQVSVVSKFAPALSAGATGATIGSSIAEIATFSGSSGPTGQIVFRAYGADDAGCSGAPVFAATVDVTPGNGTYASGSFTPTRVGAYRWTASYSGDSRHEAATSPCNAAGSISTLARAAPALAAKASVTSSPIGVPAHDTAMLAGAYRPGGTVSFRLYAPGDSGCSSAPVFNDTVPVAANGSFSSGGVAPSQPGQYRFVASYSGDAANAPATTPCSAAAQALTVTKRAPTLKARAGLSGRKISARATLSGAAAPKGKIGFQIFGPDDSRCAGKPVFSERVAVHGGGTYKPSVFQARAAGVYHLVVAYAGDARNKPVRSGCSAAGHSVRVRPR
jgi:hypothetical protein